MMESRDLSAYFKKIDNKKALGIRNGAKIKVDSCQHTGVEDCNGLNMSQTRQTTVPDKNPTARETLEKTHTDTETQKRGKPKLSSIKQS